MWIIIALILSLSVLALSLAGLGYVLYRFLSLIVSMEVGILKEFGSFVGSGKQNMFNKIKEFAQAGMKPTEGDYVPYDDEEAFVAEQVNKLKNKGLTDEELDSFVRQAVTDQSVLTPEKE
jgi:hypothetical protein